MVKQFQVTVIGSGPGGYVAAIRAAQLGMQTAIIEEDRLGGVCLNWGCIPTKTLLRSAEIVRLMKEAEHFGVKTEMSSVNIQEMVKRSRSVAGQLEAGVTGLMKKNKIEVIKGRARILEADKIEISSEGKKDVIHSKYIIIATGARARIPNALSSDNPRIWTAREAMLADAVPKSLLVVGSGAIGVEFASFYQDIGSKVTLIEAEKRILPREDLTISEAAVSAFTARGMTIKSGCKLQSLKPNAKSVDAELFHDGKTVSQRYDNVLLALGVQANIENLWEPHLGLQVKDGHLVTNGTCQSSVANIFAIGDVAGGPWVAHKESHEGVIAAEAIAGKKPLPLNKTLVPSCTYSHPQIASIGLSEDQAKALGRKLNIGVAPFSANGKALAHGDAFGFVKTIFDGDSGELLGAHLIGDNVTEQIHTYGAAMMAEATDDELAHMVFAHPSLSESLHESVLNSRGESVNI